MTTRTFDSYAVPDGRSDDHDPSPSNWGLDDLGRTSGNPTMANTVNGWSYTYESGAPDVTVFALNDGIIYNHQEFNGGRATVYPYPDECITHDYGSAVRDTGTFPGSYHGMKQCTQIVGQFCGAAPQARLVIIRWGGPGDNLGGQTTGQAVNEIVNAVIKYQRTTGRRCLVFGVGFGVDPAGDEVQAYDKLAANGIPIIYPANNNNESVDNYPPTFVKLVHVVGGYHYNGNRVSSSNYGSKIIGFAPGDHTYAGTGNGSEVDSYASFGGTSGAGPMWAGAVCRVLQAHPEYSALEIYQYMQTQARTLTTAPPDGTPDKRLHLPTTIT